MGAIPDAIDDLDKHLTNDQRAGKDDTENSRVS